MENGENSAFSRSDKGNVTIGTFFSKPLRKIWTSANTKNNFHVNCFLVWISSFFVLKASRYFRF
jgi:hypothetical protein